MEKIDNTPQDTNPAKPGTMIDGIGASEALDSSGERLSIAGLDISTLESGKGKLNWEHKSDTPSSIVGTVLVAKKIFKLEDCENDRQKYFWEKSKVPYLYIVGELFDGVGHEQAKEVAAMLRYDESKKNSPEALPNTVNFSVEGAKISKTNDGLIERSLAKKISVTVTPCNHSAIAEILRPESTKPAMGKKENKKFDTLFKSEVPVQILIKADILNFKKPAGAVSMNKPIGTTKSGISILSHKKPGEYGHISAQDHHDAMSAHYKAAQDAKDSKSAQHHLNMSKWHQNAFHVALNHEKQLKPRHSGLKKATTAGSYMSAPGSLVGGAALQKEHVRKKLKKVDMSAPPPEPNAANAAAISSAFNESGSISMPQAWQNIKNSVGMGKSDSKYRAVVNTTEGLTGKGREFIVDKDGTPRAEFIDGNFVRSHPEYEGDDRPTIPEKEDMKKAKNAKEQKAKIWGTSSQPSANSPMREKHSQHIRDFAQKRYGMELVDSGGKWDEKAGKRRKNSKDIKVGADKPDWRSNRLEAQNNPDAQTHELGHLEILPQGIDLPGGQTFMDRQYGDVQKQYGYMKQKRSQGEVQPMGVEQYLRRRMGLPANQSAVPVKPGEGPRTAVEDGGVIGTRITKPSGKVVDLIRQSRFVNPENKQRIDMVDRGELKFDPKSGWSDAARTIHGKINSRARAASADPSRKDAKTLMRSEIEMAYEHFGKSEILHAVVDAKFPEMTPIQKEAIVKMVAYRDMKKNEARLAELLKNYKDDEEE